MRMITEHLQEMEQDVNISVKNVDVYGTENKQTERKNGMNSEQLWRVKKHRKI